MANCVSFVNDAILSENKIDSKNIEVHNYLASGNFGHVNKGKLKSYEVAG